MGCKEATFKQPVQRPLYVAANTALPQLYCGTSSNAASAIPLAYGMRCFGTEFPCDEQNITHPNNHSM